MNVIKKAANLADKTGRTRYVDARNLKISIYAIILLLFIVGLNEKHKGSVLNGEYHRRKYVYHMTVSGNFLITLSVILFVVVSYIFSKYDK